MILIVSSSDGRTSISVMLFDFGDLNLDLAYENEALVREYTLDNLGKPIPNTENYY